MRPRYLMLSRRQSHHLPSSSSTGLIPYSVHFQRFDRNQTPASRCSLLRPTTGVKTASLCSHGRKRRGGYEDKRDGGELVFFFFFNVLIPGNLQRCYRRKGSDRLVEKGSGYEVLTAFVLRRGKLFFSSTLR